MKPKFDLISIGDTAYDIFLELEEEVRVISSGDTEYLGLVNAEKIPVKKFTPIVGVGNAANVAIGSSRLGLKTALYTVLGKDVTGKQTLELFKEEKVNKDYVVIDKEKGSNTSVVLNYKAERTILVHHEPRDYSLPKLAPSAFVYYTSIAKGHEKLHTQIPEYVQRTGAKLGFNPGSHQIQEGLSALKPIIEVSTVFFVNKEEAATLVGKTGEVKELLSRLYELGPKIVVITDGPKGSYCYDGSSYYFLPIFPAPLVERTGAGDSYSTGFMAALGKGFDAKEAMRWGTFNSASVIGKIGAREGLLRKDEMERLSKENYQFQPERL